MRSQFLPGVAGLAVVLTLLFGGMVFAGLCQQLITPDLRVGYLAWLWVGLFPFWWVCGKPLMSNSIYHPTVLYVAILPFLLLLDALREFLGADNRWVFVASTGVLYFVYFQLVAWVGRNWAGLRAKKQPSSGSGL